MSEDLLQYILSHSVAESDLLARLEREANVRLLHPRMVSGHLQGRLLSTFSRMLRPQRILEFGTYVGYSAICLAEGLTGQGRLITIDIDDEIEDMARRYIQASPHAGQIDFRIGDALQIVPTLDEVFDLVFIDADKRDYLAYYEAVLDKVRGGGYILADNTLWNGKVVKPVASGDHQTKGLLRFNDFVASDSRVEAFVLPIRDGMTIIRKK